MGLIAVLFVATSITSIYAIAISNNLQNGGGGATTPFNLLNQTEGYSARMQTFSNQMANGTMTAASTPPAAGGAVAGGIGAIAQAGTSAISLSADALGILLSLIGAFIVSLGWFSIPPALIGFGVLAISVGMIFAILAAVFKWWI